MTATQSQADFQNDPAYVELQEMLNVSGVTLGGGETYEELLEMSAYIELQEMLNIASVTLGGGETYEELLEMCEDMFGDIV